MTQYDATPAPRRGIGLKAPITGLVLVGLVVYGTYWGWDRAFGDDTPNEPVAGACPTPSATTTGAPTTAPATTPAALADNADTSLGSAAIAVAGEAFDTSLLGATDAEAVAATTTPVPTATQLFVQPGGVLVNVINATGRRGLAANTASVLRDRGFAVQSIGNSPADDVVADVAQIRASSLTSPQALLLIQHVPGAVIIADGRTDATIDLVLGDGFSALGDPTVVTPVPLPTTTC